MDEEAAAVEVLLTTAPEEGALGAALAGAIALAIGGDDALFCPAFLLCSWICWT